VIKHLVARIPGQLKQLWVYSKRQVRTNVIYNYPVINELFKQWLSLKLAKGHSTTWNSYHVLYYLEMYNFSWNSNKNEDCKSKTYRHFQIYKHVYAIANITLIKVVFKISKQWPLKEILSSSFKTWKGLFLDITISMT